MKIAIWAIVATAAYSALTVLVIEFLRRAWRSAPEIGSQQR